MTGRSLYQILQVDPQAESEVIEAAYRRLARKYHPDVRGPADAQPRMKEINAAYAVLRHPLHRAAYDWKLWARDMEHGRVAWSREADVWVACGRHPSSPAAGSCWGCGGALCSSCLDRFQPSTCASCVLASVGQQRADLLLRVLWFLVAFLMVGGFLLSSVAAHDPWVCPSSEAVRSLLISTYLIASVPCGWGLGGKPGEPYYFLPALFGAAIVGPVIAPFRIVKILLWDIRRLGRLAALVKADQ